MNEKELERVGLQSVANSWLVGEDMMITRYEKGAILHRRDLSDLAEPYLSAVKEALRIT